MAAKAYAGALVDQSTNTLKFTGGGGNNLLIGKFWNGTQLTLSPQGRNTLLVWQSLGRPATADQLNDYLESRLWEFFSEHKDYWNKAQPKRACQYFGIVNQPFASFSDCFVSTVTPDVFGTGELYFKLSKATDDSLEIGSYYTVDWATDCGSAIYKPVYIPE